MAPKPTILDANAVLRWILDDLPEQADVVNKLLSTRQCLVPLEVVAEVVYALAYFYKQSRAKIADVMSSVMTIQEGLVQDGDLLSHALQMYASTNLDFVDCLLDGYAKVKGNTVFTFDKALKKQLGASYSNP